MSKVPSTQIWIKCFLRHTVTVYGSSSKRGEFNAVSIVCICSWGAPLLFANRVTFRPQSRSWKSIYFIKAKRFGKSFRESCWKTAVGTKRLTLDHKAIVGLWPNLGLSSRANQKNNSKIECKHLPKSNDKKMSKQNVCEWSTSNESVRLSISTGSREKRPAATRPNWPKQSASISEQNLKRIKTVFSSTTNWRLPCGWPSSVDYVQWTCFSADYNRYNPIVALFCRCKAYYADYKL